MSSGWKKPGIDSMWPTRRFGALRYHSSLKALMVVWLMTPGDGTSGGTLMRWRGS